MSYFVTTPLGREVALGDWQTLHSDTILKVLHDHRASPFNPNGQALDLAALCNATGLTPADTKALCRTLERRGLIKPIRGQTVHARYLITDKGDAFVRGTVGAAMSGSALR